MPGLKGPKSRDCIGRKGRRESQRSSLEWMGSSQESLGATEGESEGQEGRAVRPPAWEVCGMA